MTTTTQNSENDVQSAPLQIDLRDYFAAKAMMATLTNAKADNEESFPVLMDMVARLSYMCADAMIAARKAGAA